MKPPLPNPNPVILAPVCQKCGKPAPGTRLDDMSLALYRKCWACVQTVADQGRGAIAYGGGLPHDTKIIATSPAATATSTTATKTTNSFLIVEW